jgi:group I intron endonuclease
MYKGSLIENTDVVCVYGIRCKATGRIYIGSTCELEVRLKHHFKNLKDNSKKITSHKREPKREHPFQADFNQFGIESFEVFILEENVPRKIRDVREEYWIDVYHATDPNYGYNLHKNCRQGRFSKKAEFQVPVYIGFPPIPNLGE